MGEPEKELESVLSRYPGKSVVSLKKEEFVKVRIVNGQPEVVAEHYRESMFLDENGYEYNTEYIPDSYFFEVKDIEAKSLVANGKSYKTIPVTNFGKKENLESFVFHDDMKYITFNYPSPRKGTKGILKYKEIIKEPHFFGAYYFDTPGMITRNSIFKVSVPEGVELNVRFFNLDSTKLIIEKKKEGAFTVYSWMLEDVEMVELKRDSPGYRHYSPHMVVFIKSITTNGNKINYLDGTADLHKWYYNFIRDINKDSSPELDSIALAITKNETSDIAKIKKVFYWVQDNIKYIAFEYGLGGFIPRNAKDICSKRYGDCKDMASIMNAMLNVAGVKTNLTWIGTRDIPYNYSLVPTPHSDNHMILSYTDEKNRVYFIDGTSTFNEFGYPSSFIQGKEALIHIDSNNFRVEKVPVMTAKQSMLTDSVWFKMEGSKLVGYGIATMTGYMKQDFNYMLEGKDPPTVKKLVNALFEKGNNKFEVDSFVVVNKANRDADLRIIYHFNLKDYININQDEIYLNLQMDKTYLNNKIDADRKLDIEKRFAFAHNWYFSFEIPTGYELSTMPSNVDFRKDKFGYVLKYSSKDGRIILDFTYNCDFLLLATSDFEDWNKMITSMNSTFKKSITFKKKN